MDSNHYVSRSRRTASATVLIASTGASAASRRYHVPYGRTVLANAVPGDTILCPRGGGAVVPDNSSGVTGEFALKEGVSGTVSVSVQAATGGGVVATSAEGVVGMSPFRRTVWF